jgi:hypothetical protein
LWSYTSTHPYVSMEIFWKIFSLPLCPDCRCGTSSFIFSGFFPGVKRSGLEADFSPEWSYTSTPSYVLMARTLNEDRSNFILRLQRKIMYFCGHSHICSSLCFAEIDFVKSCLNFPCSRAENQEGIWQSGGIAPPILNLCARSR